MVKRIIFSHESNLENSKLVSEWLKENKESIRVIDIKEDNSLDKVINSTMILYEDKGGEN